MTCQCPPCSPVPVPQLKPPLALAAFPAYSFHLQSKLKRPRAQVWSVTSQVFNSQDTRLAQHWPVPLSALPDDAQTHVGDHSLQSVWRRPPALEAGMGEKSWIIWIWVMICYFVFGLFYFLAIAREAREWMVTLPEALNYSSWKKLLTENSILVRTCKEKAFH